MIATDDRLRMEWVWTVKTGTPPRPVDDYPEPILYCLLVRSDDVLNALRRVQYEELQKQAKAPKQKGTWYEPMLTGDPVADAWERAIARGEDPDLENVTDG